MAEKTNSSRKLVIYGIIFSLLLGVVYFLFLEKRVHEYRLTYSVSTEVYGLYEDTLIEYFSDGNDFSISISPNFESIGDSLEERGIRRFELKEFHTGVSSYAPNDFINLFYFRDSLKVPTPELVSNRFVSSSKPIKSSVGIFLFVLSIILLGDFLYHRRKHKGTH